MKAEAMFKSCLLACSILPGGQALAGPTGSTQSPYTFNSIDFSYMNYSRPPASYFNRRPPTEFGRTPAFNGLPPPLPAAGPPARAPDVALPLTPPAPTGSPPLVEPPVQLPVVAVVPEPGTFALLGLGFALLILRERRGRPAAQ
ncbi:PEP-CTERM sorting domain-containing protein [Pseudoduganella sp. R-34]|uniref:PEP-CTERM sorting domain-containing protein n=1 Tax=Pseudoduganella sp. R-34 TaxID=3404062 RepID=UPI003CF51767